MSRTIKLSIKARGENDSPRVDDFLDQVRDYFEIMNGVEQAIAEDCCVAGLLRVLETAPLTIAPSDKLPRVVTSVVVTRHPIVTARLDVVL
jgi:hypothetical protein